MQPELTLYVAGFEEIAWGVALVAIVMVLHGLGMVWTLRLVHGFLHWQRALPNMSMAYYLSLLDYTTLGCEYDLPVRWRLLEGMIAISGLMTFAWSTGVLFTLAQEFQARVLARGRPASPGE